MLRLHHYLLRRLYHSLRTLATIAFSSVVRFAFQSTPPVRGATFCRAWAWGRSTFQSTPPCGGRQILDITEATGDSISIHAPHSGGDPAYPTSHGASSYFNPRPPCGGRLPPVAKCRRQPHFNPRPPCGGRLDLRLPGQLQPLISIHAPRVGGDGLLYRQAHASGDFNPRPPCGGRCRESVPVTQPLP